VTSSWPRQSPGGGETLWIDDKDVAAEAQAATDARYVADAWEDDVSDWIKRNGLTRVTQSEVMEHALGLPVHIRHPGQTKRLSNVLRRLGLTKHQVRGSDGKRRWVYATAEDPGRCGSQVARSWEDVEKELGGEL
jgi:hypothetical protein